QRDVDAADVEQLELIGGVHLPDVDDDPGPGRLELRDRLEKAPYEERRHAADRHAARDAAGQLRRAGAAPVSSLDQIAGAPCHKSALVREGGVWLAGEEGEPELFLQFFDLTTQCGL